MRARGCDSARRPPRGRCGQRRLPLLRDDEAGGTLYRSDGTAWTKVASAIATEIAANTVDSSKMVDGSVTTDDVAADTLTAADLAADSVAASEIATDAVGAPEIAATVDNAELAANAVTSANILDSEVGIADIAQSVWSDSVHATGTLADRPPTSSRPAGPRVSRRRPAR